MMTGARICPRCATRVDERRAKGSLYCLTCGAPLGTPPPMIGAAKKQGGSSALPWVLGGLALFLLLGTCGVGAIVVAAASSEPDAKPKVTGPATATGTPNFESTATATGTATAPPSATVAKKPPPPPPPPTFTATTPRPTVDPFNPRPTATPTPTTVPTPPPTATADLPPFPRARAISELDRVTAGLQSCKFASDPGGTGTIRVDFEPDGRVGTLRRAPFNNNATGSCISSRFLAIKIGKFEGSRQSFERTFTIRD